MKLSWSFDDQWDTTRHKGSSCSIINKFCPMTIIKSYGGDGLAIIENEQTEIYSLS